MAQAYCKNTFVVLTQFATGIKCYFDKTFANFLQLLLWRQSHSLSNYYCMLFKDRNKCVEVFVNLTLRESLQMICQIDINVSWK